MDMDLDIDKYSMSDIRKKFNPVYGIVPDSNVFSLIPAPDRVPTHGKRGVKSTNWLTTAGGGSLTFFGLIYKPLSSG
jgi:hypothetical protein